MHCNTIQWASREAAREYFLSRKLFKSFDPAMFDSYIDSLVVNPKDGSVELLIPPNAEANMYLTVPTSTIFDDAPFKLYGPAAATVSNGTYLYSGKYDFVKKRDIDDNRKQFTSMNFIEMQQPHFGPFFEPALFASTLSKLIVQGSGMEGHK